MNEWMGKRMSNNPNYFMIKDSQYREFFSGDQWVTDANKAQRFDTKAEAQAVVRGSSLKNYIIIRESTTEELAGYVWPASLRHSTR